LLFAVTFDIAVAFSTFQTGKEENAVAKSGILRAMQQDIRQAFRREEALHEEHLQTGDGSQGRHARAPADQAYKPMDGAGTHIILFILSFFVRFFIHRHVRFRQLAS
jgi:hypothetical protein